MGIKSRLSDKELLSAIYNAASAYSKLVDNSFLIIGKNKNSVFFWFQCYFERKHFMHLLGIKSKTIGAVEFYDRCILFSEGKGDGIMISDCTPSREHSRSTVNEKSSCCAEILCIQDAKYMKVGLKDKISQYVDFSYGYGNMATLGFKAVGETSFPVTLIPTSIDKFVSAKYKIIIVLRKNMQSKKYKNIYSEVKKGLFEELYHDFPEELKDFIMIDHVK
ncbi:MAG: hypothetical protein IJ427_00130 [Lachnospiraceae bacterium]|nr:hypothetical protein [Lachnospiraceae bacterium]